MPDEEQIPAHSQTTLFRMSHTAYAFPHFYQHVHVSKLAAGFHETNTDNNLCQYFLPNIDCSDNTICTTVPPKITLCYSHTGLHIGVQFYHVANDAVSGFLHLLGIQS